MNSQCSLRLTLSLRFCTCLSFSFCVSKGYSWHDNAVLVHSASPLVLQGWGAAWGDRVAFVTGWRDLWSGRETSVQMGSQKERLKPRPATPPQTLCKPCWFPILQAQNSLLIDGSWETGICSLLKAKSRVCHMSPSLRHHLLLQHGPSVIQLPLWRNATQGHMQTVDTSQMLFWHQWWWWCPGCGGGASDADRLLWWWS